MNSLFRILVCSATRFIFLFFFLGPAGGGANKVIEVL